jgi:hypothetical protein
MALVKVAEKAALKAHRSVFRQLIKDLENAGGRSAIGYYSGGFGRYSFNPGNAVLHSPVTESSMGTSQLDPLRKVIETRMADPEGIALEALKTGRLDGRRLSSNQRRQVGQAVRLANAERKAVENLDLGAYVSVPSAHIPGEAGRNRTQGSRRRMERVTSKLDNLIGSYSGIRASSPQTRKNVSTYSAGEKIVEQLEKVIKAAKNLPQPRRSEIIRDARNAQALARIKDSMGSRYYEQLYDQIPAPTGGRSARIREMRESTGLPEINVANRYNPQTGRYELDPIRDRFENLGVAMKELEGNPRAQETVLSMWKEWEGTAEELVNMARLLSD